MPVGCPIMPGIPVGWPIMPMADGGGGGGGRGACELGTPCGGGCIAVNCGAINPPVICGDW